MNKYKIRILGFANVFLLITLLFVCYRTSYYNSILRLFSLWQVRDIEKELLNFNDKPLEVVNDSIFIDSRDTISIVFLGNSITFCEPPEEFEDKTKRGLASTLKEKDYVHILVNKLSSTYHANVLFSFANIYEFERDCEGFNIEQKLADIRIKEPDFIIFQIGENIPSDTQKDRLGIHLDRLLQHYSTSVRILSLQFIGEPIWYDVFTESAINTNSYICDLSHLFHDSRNLAGTERDFNIKGVDVHPSDMGMNAIADCYYSLIRMVKDGDSR